MSHYNTNLDKNNANFVPLTPLSFLQRAKDIYPNMKQLFMRIGDIHGVRFLKDV